MWLFFRNVFSFSKFERFHEYFFPFPSLRKGSRHLLPPTFKTMSATFLCPKLPFTYNLFVCLQYHGRLRSRELCQAPLLQVFLTPRQVLSTHQCQQWEANLRKGGRHLFQIWCIPNNRSCILKYKQTY